MLGRLKNRLRLKRVEAVVVIMEQEGHIDNIHRLLIQDSQVISNLIDAALNEKISLNISRQIIMAIGSSGNQAAVAPLVTIMTDPKSRGLRPQIKSALCSLTGQYTYKSIADWQKWYLDQQNVKTQPNAH